MSSDPSPESSDDTSAGDSPSEEPAANESPSADDEERGGALRTALGALRARLSPAPGTDDDQSDD